MSNSWKHRNPAGRGDRTREADELERSIEANRPPDQRQDDGSLSAHSSGTYRDRDYNRDKNTLFAKEDDRHIDAYDQMMARRHGRAPFENEAGVPVYDRYQPSGYPQDYNPGTWSDHPRQYAGPGTTGSGPGYGTNERGMLERAGDEIMSWFGDEDAERRREADHRGKGPKGYKRSDDRIKEDVSEHLSQDRMLDASDITVEVKDGEVTLSGTVQSKHSKRHAEDCADRASGVTHVQNNLRINKTFGRNTPAPHD